MDKSSNLAKAIELGKTHEATLLNMKELAQVQRNEAMVYEVRREEPAAIVKDSIQSLREINFLVLLHLLFMEPKNNQ